jgi:mannose-6-phosphate isomerase-like protein (cupin superfamily)
LIFVVASDAEQLEDLRDESELAAGEALAVEEGEDYAVEEGSTAVLLLSDGSQINIGGGSTFTVVDLHTEPDLPYSVKIRLRAGQLFARVNRLLGSTDSFEIETPSSTSLVHGTAYGVEVVAEDASYFYTMEGQVTVALGDQSVEVHPGEETLARVGEELKVHPRGQGLANQFGVPYEELIGRFDEGYGFGQIKQVYEQSEATGIPVEDLFVLFDTGLSIGGIKRAVDLVSDYDITLDEVVARLEAGEKLNDIIRDVSGPPGNSGNRP